jgi:hypothetical protein
MRTLLVCFIFGGVKYRLKTFDSRVNYHHQRSSSSFAQHLKIDYASIYDVMSRQRSCDERAERFVRSEMMRSDLNNHRSLRDPEQTESGSR